MPQGFTEAPSYFFQVLYQDLSTCQFPRKPTRLQYVDDLLLCSVTKEVSIKDFIYLLQQLKRDIKYLKRNYNNLWTLFIT